MRDGRIVAAGEPAEVVTESMLAEVFGLAARVIPDPVAGTPLVVPIGGHAPSHSDPSVSRVTM
jgi:iron-siderophore transport system ATP-binding protein